MWIGLDEPPGTDNENPITKFWWKDDEQQLYFWDSLKSEWVLTGLMDFDRPPIVGSIEPLEHPKFPGKALEQGDLWYNTSRLELYIYWMVHGSRPVPPLLALMVSVLKRLLIPSTVSIL